MSDQHEAHGKPADDQMRVTPPGTEDPVGEITTLADAAEPDVDEILRKLNSLASTFSREEIFTALVRYDTPDVLG